MLRRSQITAESVCHCADFKAISSLNLETFKLPPMEEPLYILRMQVQACSVGLIAGGLPIESKLPWIGSDHISFRGLLRIQCWENSASNLELNYGSLLVYSTAENSPSGGFIEVDYSGASEERGYFAVPTGTFNRMLSVVLAHLSGHQAAMEIQCQTFRFSTASPKVELTSLSLSYGGGSL